MDLAVARLLNRVDLSAEPTFRVGQASVDPLSRDAVFGDTRERLQPQPLKVLVLLARRRGDVVSRQELIDCCWDGRIVGEDVINRSILVLRRFARRAGGFTIETVPRAGYRLVEGDAPANALSRRNLTILTSALAVAAIAMLVLAGSLPRRSTGPERPSVALIPFTSGSEAGARDLAAASSDAIAHMLMDSGPNLDLAWPATKADIGRADLLLTGDVRRTGQGLDASVQLRDRPTRAVIFSRHYTAAANEADALPRRIGAELASNLAGSLARMVLDRRQEVDPALKGDLLKQVALTISGEDPLLAYDLSRDIARRAPDLPMSNIAVAFDTGFALGSLPRDRREAALRVGRAASERALKLAPGFGDTYVPWCLLHPRTRLAECEDRMRAGLKADPDAPFVPAFYSSMLLSVGRNREALQYANLGLATNRYNPHKMARVVHAYILEGEPAYAEGLFADWIKLWPGHEDLYWSRLYGYIRAGDLDGAERAIAASPPLVLTLNRKQAAALFAAVRARNSAALKALCLDPETDYDVRTLCLAALRPFGDRDSAYRIAGDLFPTIVRDSPEAEERAWLERPHAGADPTISAPVFKWLRDDPRFLDLARRTSLLRYWKSGRLPDFCLPPGEPVCARIRATSTASPLAAAD